MSTLSTSEVHFEELVRLLLRKQRFIMLTAAVGTLLAGTAGLLIPARYTAKAQLVIETDHAIGRPDGAGLHVDDAVIGGHVTMLTSRSFLQRVLDSVANDGTVPPESLVKPSQALAGRLFAPSPPATAESAPEATDERHDDNGERVNVEDFFQRRLGVFQERRSAIISVNFTSTEPAEAAAVANRIANLYIQGRIERKREQTRKALAVVEARIPLLRSEVEQAEAAVLQFRVANGLVDSSRMDTLNQQLSNAQRQFALAKSALDDAKRRSGSARGLRRDTSDRDGLIEAIADPELAELHQRELVLLNSETDLATKLAQNDPKLQSVRAQLQVVRSRFDDEAVRLAAAADEAVQLADMRVRTIKQRLDELQETSRQVAEDEFRLRELQKEANAAQQVLESSLRRRRELEGVNDYSADVSLLSQAVEPATPSSPNPLYFLFPGFVLSFIGGGLLAVVRERLDRSLRSDREVSEALGISCIGIVPLVPPGRGTRPHEFVLKHPGTAYAEAIRSIAFSLFRLGGPPFQHEKILVTSSVPREGKTTLALSLAACASRLGRRVLLVEFDSTDTGVDRELSSAANRKVGYMDLEPGRNASSIHRVPELCIDRLPGFRGHIERSAISAGDQITAALNQVGKDYDSIIIDGPPLLLSAETRLLASMVDKVLVTVKWGSTTLQVAQSAVQSLADRKDPPSPAADRVCAVIVQADLKEHVRYGFGDMAESLSVHEEYLSRSH